MSSVAGLVFEDFACFILSIDSETFRVRIGGGSVELSGKCLDMDVIAYIESPVVTKIDLNDVGSSVWEVPVGIIPAFIRRVNGAYQCDMVYLKFDGDRMMLTVYPNSKRGNCIQITCDAQKYTGQKKEE